MGTTSQKIQYLGETKSLIKDSINLTGANIGSNDTFRSYATKLRDGLVDIINNGTATLYNNFPKVSGTGSNISLSNTLEAPMFMNKFDGDTLQNGTPTPSTPIEIQSVEGIQNINITGKNLFDPSVINNSKITISEDGTLNVSDVGGANGYCETGKTLSQLCPNLKVGDIVYLYIDTDFYYNGSKRDLIYCRGNWTNGTSKTITQDMLDGIVVIYGGYQTTSHIKIMITKQLETTYEPYKGNTYEVNLEGKNLLNATQESYIFTANTDNGRQLVIGTINLVANTKYYISYDVDTATTSNTRNTPYLQIGSTIIYQDSGTNKNLTTGRKVWEYTPTTSGTYSFGYWSHTPNVDLTVSKFMVSISNNTDYVPYRSPIKLYNGDYITGTPDNWSIVRENGRVVLDGSETWLKNGYSFVIVLSIGKPISLCSHFTDSSTSWGSSNEAYRGKYTTTNQDDRFKCMPLIDMTIEEFKTWLSNNNVTLVYKLATSTTTSITDTYLISQLNALYYAKSKNGQTNISVSGNLPMILEVSALKDEI